MHYLFISVTSQLSLSLLFCPSTLSFLSFFLLLRVYYWKYSLWSLIFRCQCLNLKRHLSTFLNVRLSVATVVALRQIKSFKKWGKRKSPVTFTAGVEGQTGSGMAVRALTVGSPTPLTFDLLLRNCRRGSLQKADGFASHTNLSVCLGVSARRQRRGNE